MSPGSRPATPATRTPTPGNNTHGSSGGARRHLTAVVGVLGARGGGVFLGGGGRLTHFRCAGTPARRLPAERRMDPLPLCSSSLTPHFSAPFTPPPPPNQHLLLSRDYFHRLNSFPSIWGSAAAPQRTVPQTQPMLCSYRFHSRESRQKYVQSVC